MKTRIFGFLMLASFAVFAYRYSTFRITKNFHEVDPGRFYRSAQLTPEELDAAIKQYKIKTVISLRGDPAHTAWTAPEKAVVAKNGIQFVGIWWLAEKFPEPDQLIPYLDWIDAPTSYPILVHCRTGSDRTGLAAAIYAIEKMGLPREQAIKDSLNFKYWHVEYFKPAMVAFMKIYQSEAWARTQYVKEVEGLRRGTVF